MHRQAILMSSEQQEPAMNSFYDHHKDSIRVNYRCFDRILLNGLIQPFYVVFQDRWGQAHRTL